MDLATRDDGLEARDIARKCYTRLQTLRAQDPAAELACPWSAAGMPCDEGCRCQGYGLVTVGFLITHYEGMLDLYETEEARHPLMVTLEAVVNEHEPKRFIDLYRDVEADYGSVGPTEATGQRVLHRHLARLVERGRILRIELGERLYAYLKRGSRLAADLDYCREVIRDANVG